MQKYKYTVVFFIGLMWATPENVNVYESHLESFVDHELIAQEIELCAVNQPNEVVSLIGSSWEKTFFWLNSYFSATKSFPAWLYGNPETYRELIENFPYEGKFYCFWKALWGEREAKYIKDEKDCLLAKLLILDVPEEKFEAFVFSYFSQLNMKRAQSFYQLQDSHWIFPSIILLQYKPEIFIKLFKQEPDLRFMLLLKVILDAWVTYSPDTLFIWLEKNWYDFKVAMWLVCDAPVVWKIVLRAERDWVFKQWMPISIIIEEYAEELCFCDQFFEFESKYPELAAQIYKPDRRGTPNIKHLSDGSKYIDLGSVQLSMA